MTLAEFSIEMDAYRQAVDREGKLLKDPYVALERLRALYEKFDDTERRMAEARRLLRQTDLTVEVIAARTGYRQPSFFIKQFRRDHSTTPAAWTPPGIQWKYQLSALGIGCVSK